MKYMLFIKHPRDYGGLEAPEGLYEAMGAFVEEQARRGVLLDGAGLQPLANGTRVRLAAGKISVTDGPFTEVRDVVGGYALIRVGTRDEALVLARQFMELHRIHWPGFEGECELRPLEESA